MIRLHYKDRGASLEVLAKQCYAVILETKLSDIIGDNNNEEVIEKLLFVTCDIAEAEKYADLCRTVLALENSAIQIRELHSENICKSRSADSSDI